jgi:hypothetical protein
VGKGAWSEVPLEYDYLEKGDAPTAWEEMRGRVCVCGCAGVRVRMWVCEYVRVYVRACM